MLKSTTRLVEAGFNDKLFTQNDLKRIFVGSDMRRYALVNKALKKGEWLQLKRGVYILNTKYQLRKFSKFHIACQMEPHSFISLESALAFHGWIPENVTVVSCVINVGRTKSFETPLGIFDYHFIPTQPYEFLTGVFRDSMNEQPFLIASPLRALMDYVYEKKLDWQSLDFLTDSLRIDFHYLAKLSKSEFIAMKQVYRSKKMIKYIEKLAMALERYESNSYSR